jgi:hypothetical protein
MAKRWVFVVDTEDHAGSFERWLCGYLTGRVDDPETHGGDEAEIAQKELPKDLWDYFQDHVILCLEQPDDCPINTPVVIYPTPGWFNHGMGGNFKDGQEDEAFEDYKREINEYKKEHPASALEGSPRLDKHPAYMSVGIFFDENPPENVIGVLKDRTRKFAEAYWPKRESFGGNVKVTGFRLLEEKYGEPQVLNSRNL